MSHFGSEEKLPGKIQEVETQILLHATFTLSAEERGGLFIFANSTCNEVCSNICNGLALISQHLQPPTSSQRLQQRSRLFIILLPLRRLPSRRRF